MENEDSSLESTVAIDKDLSEDTTNYEEENEASIEPNDSLFESSIEKDSMGNESELESTFEKESMVNDTVDEETENSLEISREIENSNEVDDTSLISSIDKESTSSTVELTSTTDESTSTTAELSSTVESISSSAIESTSSTVELTSTAAELTSTFESTTSTIESTMPTTGLTSTTVELTSTTEESSNQIVDNSSVVIEEENTSTEVDFTANEENSLETTDASKDFNEPPNESLETDSTDDVIDQTDLTLNDETMETLEKIDFENEDEDYQRPFKCEACGKRFSKRDELKYHTDIIHKGKKVKCEHCQEEVSSNSALMYHLKKFHKNSNEEEGAPNGVAKDPVEIGLENMFKEDINEEFQCDSCDATFASKKRRTLHQQSVHWGKTIYNCKQCDFYATVKLKLDQHITKAHSTLELDTTEDSGDINTTNVTGDSFDEESIESIQKELDSYNQTSPVDDSVLKCSSCEETFEASETLQTHVKSVHEAHETKNIKCDHCDRKFGTKTGFNYHLKSDHNLDESCLTKNEESVVAFNNDSLFSSTMLQEKSFSESNNATFPNLLENISENDTEKSSLPIANPEVNDSYKDATIEDIDHDQKGPQSTNKRKSMDEPLDDTENDEPPSKKGKSLKCRKCFQEFNTSDDMVMHHIMDHAQHESQT